MEASPIPAVRFVVLSCILHNRYFRWFCAALIAVGLWLGTAAILTGTLRSQDPQISFGISALWILGIVHLLTAFVFGVKYLRIAAMMCVAEGCCLSRAMPDPPGDDQAWAWITALSLLLPTFILPLMVCAIYAVNHDGLWDWQLAFHSPAALVVGLICASLSPFVAVMFIGFMLRCVVSYVRHEYRHHALALGSVSPVGSEDVPVSTTTGATVTTTATTTATATATLPSGNSRMDVVSAAVTDTAIASAPPLAWAPTDADADADSPA